MFDLNTCLQNRGGDPIFTFDKYTLEWHLMNEHDLIFVVRSATYPIPLLITLQGSDLKRKEPN